MQYYYYVMSLSSCFKSTFELHVEDLSNVNGGHIFLSMDFDYFSRNFISEMFTIPLRLITLEHSYDLQWGNFFCTNLKILYDCLFKARRMLPL